ncbi:MAG: prepilin-type N-terminal cleavage/methylation domain-containing protein, partial [Solobacterium sp.]|nr:prepilin-type N-terminal cleavage/methylation domain-containing protein [Solobacterium sp.]
MKNTTRKKGFALGELLAVVAIIAILAGIAFVAIMNYMRSLRQLEFDGIAKEIFVSAQNHLSMSDNVGYLGRSEFGTEEGDGVYYYVIGDDHTAVNSGDEALNLMLPFASIDETVRQGGSYVIRYHKDTARVLDVFYSSKKGTRFGHSWLESEYEGLLSARGDDHKKDRRKYGTDKCVVGWYGGETVDLNYGTELKTPILMVNNAEKLTVTVTNPNADNNNAQMRLVIKGLTSGNQIYFDLGKFSEGNVEYNPTASLYTVTLDDITTSGRHFKDLCCTGENPLLPGENIEIQAVAYNNEELTNIAWSASHQTNSLFGDGTSEENAVIGNIRHLENLSSDISSLDKETLSISKAEQISDLSWSSFKELTNQDNTKVYAKSATSKAGTFMPVIPDEDFVYNGNSLRITDVKIDTRNVKINDEYVNGGLFTALSGGSVKDLELIDFNIISNADAGSLAGDISGTEISGIFVHNTRGQDDYNLSVQGKGNTGGLAGYVEKASVTNCAAAVYVKSDESSAGGLIGSAKEVNVLQSYAAGHTEKGKYLNKTEGAARFNVQGVTAGGFIGTASDTNITNSYSTCSAKGDTAGGFVGNITNGSVSGSYATGLVQGTSDTSVTANFAAKSGDTRFDGNSYLAIINDTEEDSEGTGIDAADKNIETYDEFLGNASASPYDGQLLVEYTGQYRFRSISELTQNNTLPSFLNTHYGDWPIPETKAINVKNIASLDTGASMSEGVSFAAASYDESAALPEDVTLSLSSVQDSTGAKEAAKALGFSEENCEEIRLFDLALVSNETEVQPDAPVDVVIQMSDAFLSNDVKLVHFGKETEELPVTVNGNTVSFSTDSFSRFAFVTKKQETMQIQKDDYTLSLTFSEDAGIPEGALLEAVELEGFVPKETEITVSPADWTDGVFVMDGTLSLRIVKDAETVSPQSDVTIRMEISKAEQITETLPVQETNAKVVRETTVTASDEKTYEIKVTYDSESGIPENTKLSVKELTKDDEGYDAYVKEASKALDEAEMFWSRVFDISIVDAETGVVYEPNNTVEVSIRLLDNDVSKTPGIDVVHITEKEEEKKNKKEVVLESEVMEISIEEDVVEFETDSFSVYVVFCTNLTQTLTASDGNEYLVNVTYDSASGIPSDAELHVSEIKEGQAGYEEYVAQAAAALGQKPENLAFIRPFEITLKNAKTGDEDQPNEAVQVSIELLKDDLNSYKSVDVVHIPDSAGKEAQVMDTTVNKESVEFETDGFSVYVLIGSNGEIVTPQCTYTFWIPNEDVPGTYKEYSFRDSQGNTIHSQTVISGDELIVPQLASTDEKSFAGWYEGHTTGGTLQLEEEPYDFDHITITENSAIDLYAVYLNYATVIFHDKYDSESNIFPIAYTRRAEVVTTGEGSEAVIDAKVKISDLSVANTTVNNKKMAFFGWSETPITTPGADKDDEGNNVTAVTTDEE